MIIFGNCCYSIYNSSIDVILGKKIVLKSTHNEFNVMVWEIKDLTLSCFCGVYLLCFCVVIEQQ